MFNVNCVQQQQQNTDIHKMNSYLTCVKVLHSSTASNEIHKRVQKKILVFVFIIKNYLCVYVKSVPFYNECIFFFMLCCTFKHLHETLTKSEERMRLLSTFFYTTVIHPFLATFFSLFFFTFFT